MKRRIPMFIEHKWHHDEKWHRCRLERVRAKEPLFYWRMIDVDGRLAHLLEHPFRTPTQARLWAMRYRGGRTPKWRRLDTTHMQSKDWNVHGETTERSRVIRAAIAWHRRNKGKPRKPSVPVSERVDEAPDYDAMLDDDLTLDDYDDDAMCDEDDDVYVDDD